jgi:hypothetical protein
MGRENWTEGNGSFRSARALEEDTRIVSKSSPSTRANRRAAVKRVTRTVLQYITEFWGDFFAICRPFVALVISFSVSSLNRLYRSFHHHHWPQPSFWESAEFDPVFTYFDFATFFFFFFHKAKSSALRPSLNLEHQVCVFMCPSDRMAQLYLQASDSLFVAFYDSQGLGGGIRTHLHTGRTGVGGRRDNTAVCT